MVAVSQGQTDIVRILLDAGADVNVKDYKGDTALKLAESKGNADIIQMLKDAPPTTVRAEAQLDRVLGVPWGASPAQARQIMEQNGFSYARETKDPQLIRATGGRDGTYIISFTGGVYAGYQVDEVYVYIMNNQMIELKVHLWAENVGGESMLNNVFADLKKLLTEKYGAPSGDGSFKMPVNSPPTPTL